MQKIFCFGEALLRFSPVLGGEWIKHNNMPFYIGGAELNVAAALARWQVPVAYGTALPDNYLSKEIIEQLKKQGIDTTAIKLCGNRMGSYYLPQGADLKNAGVIYDRAYSSFYELQPGQINWEEILQDKSWFHFSAISPALNANVAAVCKEALEAAQKLGLTISVDLNYRAKLWQWGKTPDAVMPGLVQYCHVVMGNLWAAEKMLGIALPADLQNNKEAYIAQSEETSKEIIKSFPTCNQVANTFRFDVQNGIDYYATLYRQKTFFVSPSHHTNYIVDKVGSGDCFMAGLIYGNFKKLPPQEIIDFASAAAFNKLFITGDATTATVEDIMKASLTYE